MKTSNTLSILFIIIVINTWMILQTPVQNNKSIAPPQQQISKPGNQKEASMLLKEKKALEILAPFKVL